MMLLILLVTVKDNVSISTGLIHSGFNFHGIFSQLQHHVVFTNQKPVGLRHKNLKHNFIPLIRSDRQIAPKIHGRFVF